MSFESFENCEFAFNAWMLIQQEISDKHEESIGVGRRELQITHHSTNSLRRLVRELLFKRSNGSFQLETEENGTVESWQQSEWNTNRTSKE